MKKTLAFLLLFSIAGLVSAQEKTSGLQSGNLATEVQLNITNGWFGNIVVPTIRFRYGLSDKYYLRADLDGNINKSFASFFENPDGSGAEGTTLSANSFASLGLGVERHVSPFKKLSPYFGGQLVVTKSNYEQEFNNARSGRYEAGYEYISSRPSVGGEAYLFTGFDFWVYDRLYLGTEFGVSFGQTWYGETKTSVTQQGVTTETNRGPATQFMITKQVNPSIRVGYVIR
jgi:hypothetical protein